MDWMAEYTKFKQIAKGWIAGGKDNLKTNFLQKGLPPQLAECVAESHIRIAHEAVNLKNAAEKRKFIQDYRAIKARLDDIINKKDQTPFQTCAKIQAMFTETPLDDTYKLGLVGLAAIVVLLYWLLKSK